MSKWMSRSLRLVAVTARRSEPDWLVDDLIKNLAWVDEVGVIEVDKAGPWGHEGKLNARKRELARSMGAGWVLFIDPDERIEDAGGPVVRELLAHANVYQPDTVFGFALKEMWTPTQYRIDGDWGRKLPRMRLFKLRREGSQRFANKPIHCGVSPRSVNTVRVPLPINLYHLKNIEPANRRERAKAYHEADPKHEHQRIEGNGWGWLYDEAGMELEAVPEDRQFTPGYHSPYLFTAPS